LIYSVSYIARSKQIDRIVALDEFDMENVSALREHLRIPGMASRPCVIFATNWRCARRAQEAGMLVPEFVHVLNHDNLREFMNRVPGPWLLKPRSQASGIGMKKIHAPEELWPWLDQLGDQQSFYLLEQFVPGSVYHSGQRRVGTRRCIRAAHAYGTPPLDTSHHGGVFTTRTLPHDAAETKTLQEINRNLLVGLGFVRGVTHAEIFEVPRGRQILLYRSRCAVGGAYIADVIEVASGHQPLARMGAARSGAGKQPYELPPVRREHAGVFFRLRGRAPGYVCVYRSGDRLSASRNITTPDLC